MSDGAVDYRGALEAVERVLNRGGDAGDVIRSVLEVLRARGVEAGRVRYGEDEAVVGEIAVGLGPPRTTVPVVFRGEEVGSLELGVHDRAFAERVATLISAYVWSAALAARSGP